MSAVRVPRVGIVTFLVFLAGLIFHAGGVRAEGGDPASLDCVITPSVQIELSSAVPGLLEQVLVRRSDRVHRDQLVARLESKVEQASAVLARGWARFETEEHLQKVGLSAEQRKQLRLSELYQRAAVPLDLKQDADSQVEASQLRVKQAEDRRWLRELESKKADAALNRRNVRSPIDGVVIHRYLSSGEYVENEPILRLAKLNPLHVETIVPMSQFGEIKPGMRAVVVPEAPADTPVEARVSVVDAAGDAASGTFGVRLEVDNSGFRIPAGLKCKVQILPESFVSDESKQSRPSLGVPAMEDQLPTAIEASSPNDKHEAPAPAPEQGFDTVVAQAKPLDVRTDEPQATSAVSPAPSCARLGPVADDHVDEARQALESAGFEATRRAIKGQEKVGVVILSPMLSGVAETEAYITMLSESGFRDRQLLTRGPYKGRVALGTYRSEASSKGRQSRLRKLGFQTEVVERTRNATETWFDLRHTGISGASERALSLVNPAIRASLTFRAEYCTDLLAVSR